MKSFQKNLLWYLVFALVVLGGLILETLKNTVSSDILTVAALNIGQGDSIYVEGPSHVQMLFDGGPPNGKVLTELPKVMPFGDHTIDVLVVTNPDLDHYGGFLDVLKKYDVGMVVEPGVESTNVSWRALQEKIKSEQIPLLIARRGQTFDLGGGAHVKILFPDRDVSNFSHNDGSIVARLEYASTSVMLTGDTTKIIEAYLVNHYPEDLPSTILKVAHHGSKTSTSPDFVKAVAPAYALISCGVDNQYDFPHQLTLDTLEKFGVKVFRTDLDGTIILHSDGTAFSFQ